MIYLRQKYSFHAEEKFLKPIFVLMFDVESVSCSYFQQKCNHCLLICTCFCFYVPFICDIKNSKENPSSMKNEREVLIFLLPISKTSFPFATVLNGIKKFYHHNQ